MGLFLLITTFISGIVISVVVVKKPNFFWPILIVVSVGTTGLLIGGRLIGGYHWVDEFLLGCLLFGAVVVMWRKKGIFLKKEEQNFASGLHLKVFFLFVSYMILQYVRGFFLWEGDIVKIIRWIIYFLMMGFLAFVLTRVFFSFLDKKKALSIISLSAFLYLFAYLIHGVISEVVRGINRYNLQSIEWSGTGYATFPLIIAAPAAIILLREKELFRRLLAISLLFLGILVSVYYESRVSLFAIVIFLLFLGFAMKISITKKIAIFLIFVLVSIILVGAVAKHGIWDYWTILTGGDKKYEIWGKQGGDIDRYIHLRASVDAVNKNWQTFLFGYGSYSHRSVLVPYIQKLADHYRLDVVVKSPVRTETFMALLVDVGWIGVMLFGMNFLFVLWFIKKSRSTNKLILSLTVLITFLWLFAINIQDIILLYLLIMPNGLVLLLIRGEKDEKLEKIDTTATIKIMAIDKNS